MDLQSKLIQIGLLGEKLYAYAIVWDIAKSLLWGCTILHFHQNWFWVPISPYPCQQNALWSFWNFAYFVVAKWYQCSFNWHFSYSDYLFNISLSAFFPSISVWAFPSWFFWAVYILGILALYLWYALQIFSHYIMCLLTLFMVILAMQKIFSCSWIIFYWFWILSHNEKAFPNSKLSGTSPVFL